MLKALRAEGHHVTFFALSAAGRAQYSRVLEKLGIACYGVDRSKLPEEPEQAAQLRSAYAPPLPALRHQRRYDTVQIDFWNIAEALVPRVREHLPEATVVIDSVDLHFVRERREAELRGTPELLAKARATRQRELATYRSADRVLVVTADEETILRGALGQVDLVQVPIVHEPADQGPGFEDRDGILFVGNFNHPPNLDAVRWWAEEIGPRLDALLPGVTLTVVGGGPFDPDVLAAGGIDYLGWVLDLQPRLHAARVSVAPLRFGAGMKGKVSEALAAGVPTVVTSIAAEGMGLVDGADTLLAYDADGFAKAVVRLYTDAALWEALR